MDHESLKLLIPVVRISIVSEYLVFGDQKPRPAVSIGRHAFDLETVRRRYVGTTRCASDSIGSLEQAPFRVRKS